MRRSLQPEGWDSRTEWLLSSLATQLSAFQKWKTPGVSKEEQARFAHRGLCPGRHRRRPLQMGAWKEEG